MSNLRRQVGKMIRHHRELAAISQASLAERSDKSVQLIGRIERGESAPSFETLEAISKVLSVPVRDFFGTGQYSVGSMIDTDPLARLINRIAGLSENDLEWLDQLVANALQRKPPT